jgi:hypothetical protein
MISFQDSGDESKEGEWVEKVVCTSEEASAYKTCEKECTSHAGPSQDEYRPKSDVLQDKQGTGFLCSSRGSSWMPGCHGD